MKTRIVVIILSILLLLTSCGQSVSSKYSIFELTTRPIYGRVQSDTVYLSHIPYEYHRPEALTNLELEIDGILYNLEYEKSLTSQWEFDLSYDLYKGYSKTNDEIKISVNIRPKNGDLIYFHISHENYLSKKEESNAIKLDRDGCFTVANEFLIQNVADFSDYELVEESYDGGGSYKGGYYFTFAHMINGIKTSNQILVSVTMFGDVVHYDARFWNGMKDSEPPSEEDMRIIQAEVNEFIKSKYEGYVLEYYYEISDVTFMRLYDGRYALIYEVQDRVREEETDIPIEEDNDWNYASVYLVYV